MLVRDTGIESATELSVTGDCKHLGLLKGLRASHACGGVDIARPAQNRKVQQPSAIATAPLDEPDGKPDGGDHADAEQDGGCHRTNLSVSKSKLVISAPVRPSIAARRAPPARVEQRGSQRQRRLHGDRVGYAADLDVAGNAAIPARRSPKRPGCRCRASIRSATGGVSAAVDTPRTQFGHSYR